MSGDRRAFVRSLLRRAAPGAGRCQWIRGEPTADDSCKCGRPVAAGSRTPYCETHLRRAYLVRPPRVTDGTA